MRALCRCQNTCSLYLNDNAAGGRGIGTISGCGSHIWVGNDMSQLITAQPKAVTGEFLESACRPTHPQNRLAVPHSDTLWRDPGEWATYPLHWHRRSALGLPRHSAPCPRTSRRISRAMLGFRSVFRLCNPLLPFKFHIKKCNFEVGRFGYGSALSVRWNGKK